jgi:hypothetical protein
MTERDEPDAIMLSSPPPIVEVSDPTLWFCPPPIVTADAPASIVLP